jgi:hypothetical protein
MRASADAASVDRSEAGGHPAATGRCLTLLPEEEGRDVSTSVRILAHVHRVPNRNLWLWYWWTEAELTLVALTNVPPT